MDRGYDIGDSEEMVESFAWGLSFPNTFLYYLKSKSICLASFYSCMEEEGAYTALCEDT